MYGSYAKQVVDPGCVVANPTAIILEAAANTVVLLSRPLMEPITVTRFGYQVTVAFDYDGVITAQGKLALYRYPQGNATNKVLLQEIDLQDDLAAGVVAYADVPNPMVDPVKVNGVITVRGYNKADFNAGDVVAIWVDTMAVGTGGTELGDYQPYFCCHPRAEVCDNQPLMLNLTP
jgi:hypothetical protein